MLFKIFFIISILCKFNLLCYGIHISTYNETKLIHSMNSQLSELRAEQELHLKLINGLVKAIDILGSHFKYLNQSLKASEKLTDGLVKESDIQLLRADISSLKAEHTGIKSNRDELDQLGKLLNGLVKECDIQFVKTDIESIKEDLKRQGKQTDKLVKDIDKLYLRSSPRNCAEARTSGINEIFLSNCSCQSFKVLCDLESRGGGWTVILRRMDGSVDFQRNWTEYKNGFGELGGEFFLGLDKIHALTADRDHELLVLLEDNDGIEAFEAYDEFAIGNEEEQYVLHKLGKANGTARNPLGYYRDMKFSTFDRDNDFWEEGNCAKSFTGGWWYKYCYISKLTGTYNNNDEGMGVIWSAFEVLNIHLKKRL